MTTKPNRPNPSQQGKRARLASLFTFSKSKAYLFSESIPSESIRTTNLSNRKGRTILKFFSLAAVEKNLSSCLCIDQRERRWHGTLQGALVHTRSIDIDFCHFKKDSISTWTQRRRAPRPPSPPPCTRVSGISSCNHEKAQGEGN